MSDATLTIKTVFTDEGGPPPERPAATPGMQTARNTTFAGESLADAPPPERMNYLTGKASRPTTGQPPPEPVRMDLAEAMKQFGEALLGRIVNGEKVGPADLQPAKPAVEPQPPPTPAPKPEAITAETVNGGEFPATHIGPDGKVYSGKAVEEARKRIEQEQAKQESKAAYEAFRPDREQVEAEKAAREADKQAREAQKQAREAERLDNKATREQQRERDKADREAAKAQREAEKQAREAERLDNKATREQQKARTQAEREEKKAQREREKLEAQANREFDKSLKGEKQAADKAAGAKDAVRQHAEGNTIGAIPGAGAAKESMDLIKGGAMKMGGMAAVGAVLPLVTIAAEGLTKSFQSMKKNVDTVTGAMETMAVGGKEREGLAQLGEGFAEGMKDTMKSIPIVGDMAAAQLDLMQSIIKLPERLTLAFLQQGQRLEGYSGQITAAGARANVRDTMADVKEAREMGADYGRMIDAQSKLDNTVREMLLPIKKFVVDKLALRLEIMAEAANVAKNLPEILGLLVDKGSAAIVAAVHPTKSVAKVIEDFKNELFAILNKQDVPKDFFDQFFDDVDAMQFGPNVFSG